jgi:two-component system cell cycle sensor histidine kinase/response regulator CckA
MPTVLLVDDEAPVREVAARMLRQAGYETIQAVDGREAWTQLQRTSERIDALLADVVMPTMTGTELLALVLANRPELPIALMSGFPTEALRARGLEEPPVPLLTKPFTQEQLVALMERLLPPGSDSPAIA